MREDQGVVHGQSAAEELRKSSGLCHTTSLCKYVSAYQLRSKIRDSKLCIFY